MKSVKPLLIKFEFTDMFLVCLCLCKSNVTSGISTYSGEQFKWSRNEA